MAGTESREREAVKNAYPGTGWKQKVQNWSDQQVLAVYFRLKSQNKV